MSDRILQIDGVRNVRDLGGIINKDGKVLRKDVFIRTGSLHTITKLGNETIDSLGVETVIDLRSKVEVEKKPDNARVKYHYWVPMLDKFQSEIAKNEFPKDAALNNMYITLLEEQKEEFKKTFNLITSHIDDGAILYHCTAGKDRTGILSMLLLSVANVSNDEIIKDYALTKPLMELVNKYPKEVRILFYAPPEAMSFTLDWISKNYESPIRYLKEIGVLNDEMDIIRNKFEIL